ncbi:MAG TPA: YidC/Oxa1 family membrane protein insertase, partial [Thermoleophilaceae bacterium]
IGLGWGLAIIGLTLLVRMSTLPLVLRQMRSQRELRAHMPELKRLRERHKGDRERLQRETAAYYREHGIKPLAAFAPLLIQIPVFISLYYLMRTDVKNGLFGEDGFLFIPHLVSKPHGAVLVALLISYLAAQVASSVIATRTLAGGQRGVMLMLPLLFASVITRVPAGLGVYWVTSGMWGFGQQLALWRAAPAGVPAPATAVAAETIVEAEHALESPRRDHGATAPSPRKRKSRKHGRRR